MPGVSGAIFHDGKAETQGYGVISRETDYPTGPDTLFQAGFNRKVFASTLVMRLAEEGLLDLDAPIGAYLPDLALTDQAALTASRCATPVPHQRVGRGPVRGHR